MTKPASLVPLKNIFLLWTESSDHSRLNRPLTWSEAELAIQSMAAVAPEPATTRLPSASSGLTAKPTPPAWKSPARCPRPLPRSPLMSAWPWNSPPAGGARAR